MLHGFSDFCKSKFFQSDICYAVLPIVDFTGETEEILCRWPFGIAFNEANRHEPGFFDQNLIYMKIKSTYFNL